MDTSIKYIRAVGRRDETSWLGPVTTVSPKMLMLATSCIVL